MCCITIRHLVFKRYSYNDHRIEAAPRLNFLPRGCAFYIQKADHTLSKTSTIFLSGSAVQRETTTMKMQETTKAGSSS